MEQLGQIMAVIKKIIVIYKKNEDKLNMVFKFLAGLFVFGRISLLSRGSLGSGKVMLLTLICAVLTMIVSPNIFMIMMGLLTCLYIATVSLESALVVFCGFFLIFVFYVRIFPKESLVIPVMLGAYFLNIPYIVPIVVGLYIGIRGLGAIGITVFLQHSKGILEAMIDKTPSGNFELMGMLDGFLTILDTIIQNFSTDWIYIAGVFMLSSLCAWAIGKMSIDYEKLIAVAASGIVLFIGLLICNIVADGGISIIGMILGIPISCLLVYFFICFDFVLDYRKTEYVRFQDDCYMYYVKAVPKIKR